MNSACWRSAAVAAKSGVRTRAPKRSTGVPVSETRSPWRTASPPRATWASSASRPCSVTGWRGPPSRARAASISPARPPAVAGAGEARAAASTPRSARIATSASGLPISAVTSTTPRPARRASLIAATPGPATGVPARAVRNSRGERSSARETPAFQPAAPASRRRTPRGRSGRTSARFWRTSAGQPWSGETAKRTAAPSRSLRAASGRPSVSPIARSMRLSASRSAHASFPVSISGIGCISTLRPRTSEALFILDGQEDFAARLEVADRRDDLGHRGFTLGFCGLAGFARFGANVVGHALGDVGEDEFRRFRVLAARPCHGSDQHRLVDLPQHAGNVTGSDAAGNVGEGEDGFPDLLRESPVGLLEPFEHLVAGAGCREIQYRANAGDGFVVEGADGPRVELAGQRHADPAHRGGLYRPDLADRVGDAPGLWPRKPAEHRRGGGHLQFRQDHRGHFDALAFEHPQEPLLVDALEHLPGVALEIHPRLVSQPRRGRRRQAFAHEAKRVLETVGELQPDPVDFGEKLLGHRFERGVVDAAQPRHLLSQGELHFVGQAAQRHIDPLGNEKPDDHRRLLRPRQRLDGPGGRRPARAAAPAGAVQVRQVREGGQGAVVWHRVPLEWLTGKPCQRAVNGPRTRPSVARGATP